MPRGPLTAQLHDYRMAYPPILTQAQVQPHIQNTWLGINAAVLALRAMGLTGIWMPAELKFDAIIVDQVQQIPILTTTTGTDTAVTTATTTDTTTQTTTHGETNSTTDNGQTLYVAGDLGTAPGSGYLAPPVSLPF